MEKRPFEEAVEWIHQQINQMDIEERYKPALIGMITALESIHNETISRRVLCMNCQHHCDRTQRCDIWMKNTPPDGYCYRAKERSDQSNLPREEILERQFRFLEALDEAVEKEQYTFTCPVCNGEVRWIRAELNGHIHAVCYGPCGMRVYE